MCERVQCQNKCPSALSPSLPIPLETTAVPGPGPPSHCVCVSLCVHVPVCVYKSFQRGFKYVYTHTPVCTCRVFLLLHKQRLGPRPVPHLALFTSRCILAISPHQHIESVLLLLISAWHHGGEFLRTLRTSGAGRMLLCRQTLSVNEWVNE